MNNSIIEYQNKEIKKLSVIMDIEEDIPSLNHTSKTKTSKVQDEVDNKILEENNRELKNIYEDLTQLESLFQKTGKKINKQGDDLNIVEDNVEKSEILAHTGLNDLEIADKYARDRRTTSSIVMGGVMGGGTLGTLSFIISGISPAVGIAGLIIGGVLGGGSGYLISKTQD